MVPLLRAVIEVEVQHLTGKTLRLDDCQNDPRHHQIHHVSRFLDWDQKPVAIPAVISWLAHDLCSVVDPATWERLGRLIGPRPQSVLSMRADCNPEDNDNMCEFHRASAAQRQG